jgi:PGF-pre-PGF domain-containing protein
MYSTCPADCGIGSTPFGGSSSSSGSSSTTDQSVLHINSIAAGGVANVTIGKAEGVDFSEIDIQVANKVSSVYLTVTKVDANPAGAPVLQNVYSYVSVVKQNINDQDISSATIKFKVEKTWVTQKGIDSSTIALYRYSNSVWNKLETSKLSEDSTYYYFQAKTPGFSYFAISGAQASAVTTTTTTLPGATTTVPSATTTVPEAGAANTTGLTAVTILAIVVIVLILIGLLIFRPKKIK